MDDRFDPEDLVDLNLVLALVCASKMPLGLMNKALTTLY